MYNSEIDKVKLLLNPIFLNKDRAQHIRADNALTLHNAGNFTFLAVHAEYFNPYFDYKTQIAKAIFELIEKKVINFPMDNPIFTFMFVLQNMEYFILGVSQVEFFFDFPFGKVSVAPAAIENGDIIQYKDKSGNLCETYYTNDYEKGKTKSSFCIYNKYIKLIKDRHISHKAIEKMNVEYRIEARLTRGNCQYLDLVNLTGTFEDIFKRFKPLLAVLYYTRLYGCVEVTGKSNTYFSRLIRQVEKERVKYFNKNRLKKSEPIKDIPENGTLRRYIQMKLLEKYFLNMNNEKTTIDTGKNGIEMTDLEVS